MLNALPTSFVGTDPSQRSWFRAPRTLLILAAAAALAGSTAIPAVAAPGDTSDDTTVANVGVTSAIVLTALTPSFTLNGLPGAIVTGLNAVSFNVETNNIGGYAVTVQAEDDVLASTAQGNTDEIPIAALRVRESGGGAYTSVTDAAPLTVHSQATRSASGGDNLSNDYQVSIPFVADDTYSVTLDYVATAL